MTSLHSAFTGEIPQNYEKYLGPLIFQEYAEDLSRRATVTNGGVVLETAAGTGLATRQLRAAIPKDVRIVATDLNGDMLKFARGKVERHENIEFQTANAMHLPFDDSVFDAVVSQFSIMFFPDKLTSLKEAARVLKPNGEFLFIIFRANLPCGGRQATPFDFLDGCCSLQIFSEWRLKLIQDSAREHS